MIAISCVFLLSVMAFQVECCHINKVVMNPFTNEGCTDIHSTINCPPRFMKHGPLCPHRAMALPALPNCDPFATKITSTVLPPTMECIEPLMTKCCCIECAKPFPTQGLPIPMLPNDCWC